MTPDHPPRISVVMPVYNEMATIGEILGRVQAVDVEKEIVIVDDGSTDGTRKFLDDIVRSTTAAPPEIALSQGGAVPRVDNIRVFFQDKNREKEPPCAGDSRRRAVTSSSSRMPTWNTTRRTSPG